MSFHRLDVRSPAVVELITHRRPVVIFHLAAQADVRVSVANPTFDAEVNIGGSLNVCEGALAAGSRKVVFAGSGGTLYGVPEALPVGERHPRHPVSPYGVAKKAVGDYLHYYREIRELDYTVLALANVYGPRQDPHGEAGVVAIFAGRLLAGERCKLFDAGRNTRDYTYVDDVVDGFVRAADAGEGVLNIGTGVETSINELLAVLWREVGRDGEPDVTHTDTLPVDVQRRVPDVTKINERLGWYSKVTLEDGIKRTVDWYRETGVVPAR